MGEGRGPVAARLGFAEMRMEDDLCAAASGPTNRFRISPAFMANGHAESQRAGLKDASFRARPVSAVFGGVHLDFVLKACDGSVSIDDEGCDSQRAFDDAFGAQNDR